MENKPQPHDEAYLKYLSGLVQPEQSEPAPKPSFGRRPPPTPRTKFKRPNVYVVCGGLLIVVLFLIVRAILFPGTGADNSPEFLQRQQYANSWAVSGARAIVLSRLKSKEGAEITFKIAESKCLGGDRWRVGGTAYSAAEQGLSSENQWVAEIEYSDDKKTGEVARVFLDDELIYSR